MVFRVFSFSCTFFKNSCEFSKYFIFLIWNHKLFCSERIIKNICVTNKGKKCKFFCLRFSFEIENVEISINSGEAQFSPVTRSPFVHWSTSILQKSGRPESIIGKMVVFVITRLNWARTRRRRDREDRTEPAMLMDY